MIVYTYHADKGNPRLDKLINILLQNGATISFIYADPEASVQTLTLSREGVTLSHV